MKARREVSCQGRFFAARYPEYNNITCPSWIKTNQFVQSDEFEFVLTFPPLCFWTFQRPCKTETNIQQDDQVPYRLSKYSKLSYTNLVGGWNRATLFHVLTLSTLAHRQCVLT